MFCPIFRGSFVCGIASVPGMGVHNVKIFPSSKSRPSRFIGIDELHPLGCALRYPAFEFLEVFSKVLCTVSGSYGHVGLLFSWVLCPNIFAMFGHMCLFIKFSKIRWNGTWLLTLSSALSILLGELFTLRYPGSTQVGRRV